MLKSTKTIFLRRCLYAGVSLVLLACLAFDSSAAELQRETIQAFHQYVHVAESQMNAGFRPSGPFLWVDSLPEHRRQRLVRELHDGQLVIRQIQTAKDGRLVEIPDGMVHHWLGIVFVPGITLKTAERVLQNYNDYARIYAPEVRRSRILGRTNDGFKLYLQLYKDSPRRVSFNADFDVQSRTIDAEHAISSSVSTRIAELQDPSQPDSAELPVGSGNGYLWRMNDYWRYEQKDGGVYIQVESIVLSRDVPAIFAWFVNPLIRRIARNTMADLLESTRNALENPKSPAGQSLDRPSATSPSPVQ